MRITAVDLSKGMLAKAAEKITDAHVKLIQAAEKAGLVLTGIAEYFDDNDRNAIPRILTLLLRKA